jgi:hypothetical protein
MAEVRYKNGSNEIRVEQFHSLDHQKSFFFHSIDFTNREKGAACFFFNLYEDDKPLTSIAFEIVDDIAISLPRSPFGGFIIGYDLDADHLAILLKVIIDYFHKHQYRIQIKFPPQIYAPSIKVIHEAMIENKFSILHRDINQHIRIEKTLFSAEINRNRRRKLDHAANQNYSFEKLDGERLSEAYDLITECREEKGYPVTMTLQELQTAFKSFPDQYLLFGVFDQERLIATAVSIQVNQDVLYNFYHGDCLSHRSYSPVTLLVAGIYGYCQEHHVEILDLGISTDRGVLNEGLYYFKESCGARPSDKITYQLIS